MVVIAGEPIGKKVHARLISSNPARRSRPRKFFVGIASYPRVFRLKPNSTDTAVPRGPALTISESRRKNSRYPPGLSVRRHSRRQRSYSSVWRPGGWEVLRWAKRERAEMALKWWSG